MRRAAFALVLVLAACDAESPTAPEPEGTVYKEGRGGPRVPTSITITTAEPEPPADPEPEIDEDACHGETRRNPDGGTYCWWPPIIVP